MYVVYVDCGDLGSGYLTKDLTLLSDPEEAEFFRSVEDAKGLYDEFLEWMNHRSIHCKIVAKILACNFTLVEELA